jgi:hypothetical protein
MATIYRITSTAGDKIYIGSTTQFVAKRWSVHKADHLRGHPCTSQILFDEYGIDSCSMEEIEKVDLDSRFERERFWIENTENCVNIVVPGRTRAEYYLDNRERRLENQKAYDLANKERKSEYAKAYRLANSDKIKARKSERVTCPTCGQNLAKNSLANHNKLHIQKN